MSISVRRRQRSQVKAPVSQILVRDTFTRTVNAGLGVTDTGQPWQVINGTWTVNGTTARIGANAGGMALVECGRVDTSVAADFIGAGSGVYLSIVIRASAADTHYRAQHNEGTGNFDIYKKIHGTETYLGYAQAPAADKAEFYSQTIAGGVRLTLFYNNTAFWDYTDMDANAPSGTKCGFDCWNGSAQSAGYDNLLAINYTLARVAAPAMQAQSFTIATPTVVGTGSPYTNITVSVNGSAYSAGVNADGTWAVLITNPLATNQTYPVSLTAKDKYGNQSSSYTSAITIGAITPTSTMPLGVGGAWHMIFQDEFGGTSLNTSVWRALRGNVNDGEWGTPCNQAIEDAGYAKSHVTVSGGMCNLRCTKDQFSQTYSGKTYTYNHTSGYIQSDIGFTFTYGYVESRIFIPGDIGYWPAFWSTPAMTWPPEIDIAEFFESNGHLQPTANLHWADPATPGGSIQRGPAAYGDAALDFSSDWHVYGMLWEPGRLAFYLDGTKWIDFTHVEVPSQPMMLIFNLAVRLGSFPAPAAMLIDYVRVWQSGA